MPYILEVSIRELVNAGFSHPTQANSFYPAGDRHTHLHLGTPTAHDGRIARPGNVLVTYIGVKVRGQNLGNIPRCSSGYFDLSRAPHGTPGHFITVLENLDLLVDGCGWSSLEEDIKEVCRPDSQHGQTDRPNGSASMTQEQNIMSTQYKITINMSQTTANDLTNGKFQLYAFKGVASTIGGGQPLVWFKSNTFGKQVHISWHEQYQAYTSQSKLVPNGQNDAANPYDIDLDQTLVVQSDNGTGAVQTGGTKGAISIQNQSPSGTQMLCGISEVVGGTAMPLCAFPLYGTGLDVMAPEERVFLMFATDQVDTGTVIYKAYTQGVLIDLTGPVRSRTVQYDMNQGWSWGGHAWGQKVKANARLAPLLIDSSPSLQDSIRMTAQEVL